MLTYDIEAELNSDKQLFVVAYSIKENSPMDMMYSGSVYLSDPVQRQLDGNDIGFMFSFITDHQFSKMIQPTVDVTMQKMVEPLRDGTLFKKIVFQELKRLHMTREISPN